ncbi:Ig-like domain-containing protein [Salinibacterium sp. ZJ77]|uniref:Ig-like domain-containing protein n=1 Tax=Salinibacterium sp. ZJ77 TaxID=2708337 RepID=UPI001421F189|nr:Ig-like domain-containing protein [Salinibacterium sp. ZJ77]
MSSWFSTRRPLLATITSSTAVAVLVATVAIVSTGYTAQRMDLTDPSVWVAGASHDAIGRANTAVFELDSTIETDAEQAELVQSGSTVILVDRASATMRVVDPATAELGEAVSLPPQNPSVHLAEDRVVIFAETGEVWFVLLSDVASFDAAVPSALSLGTGAVLALTDSGALLAYVPDATEVWRVEPGASVVGQRSSMQWSGTPPVGGSVQITAVGEEWVVFDADSGQLSTAAGAKNLSSVVSGSSARVQMPGPAADGVLVAHTGGLASVPLGDGDARVLVDSGAGVPAAPVVVDGCRFAAWSGGSAWRGCPREDGIDMALAGLAPGPRLAFAVNQGRVVLNDALGGESWAVQASGELIDNWESLLVDQDREEETPQADDETPPELEEVQQPPTAVDDDLGARPGRTTVLPVLLNDYDPNGDVLVITAFDQIDETIGRLDLVSRNQQLQLTLASDASGQISFGYTISDGRGGFASAVVTVTVRSDAENSPPRAVRTSTANVDSGGRVSTQVLGDWIDPDGDAIYLTSASVAAPDQVGFKPDGVIVFTDGGEGIGGKTIAIGVSDGRDTAGGSLQVTVRERGDVPILVEPWVVLASAGEEVTIRPLQHVRGGNAPIRLGGVPPKAGTTLVPSFDAGTFTFLSTEVRTHYLEFTVTDGTQTATGVVRVDVTAPADASTRPITVPKTLFMTTDSTQLVDPPTSDIDPAGGVLVVTGVGGIPAGVGITAEVLDQRRVRVSLTAPLSQPVTFSYRISNGLASADGTITVVEIPRPIRMQPPIATDDHVTVRAGDTIDIHVLDNDEQPDGGEIALLPELASTVPADAGLLFTAGDRLRYLAPETAGIYEGVYTVAGTDGQLAQARVVISVRERNASTNNPPVPRTVTARTLAGKTVSIDIPVNGVDPDGDTVTLVGQSTNPEKGAIVGMEGSTLRYQAGEYSSGTDVFHYTVVDGLGARATGTIRVGISPSLEGARNPVANYDTVSVRVGRTVSVRPLVNDSDPDGSALRIRQVEPNTPDVVAEIVGDDVVRITPPGAGDFSVVYTIENETGGTSSAFIRVNVSDDAPLAWPVITDTELTVTDVIDRSTVDVSVLDRAFFADGEARDLGVELVAGFAQTAEVLPNKRVRVTIGERSQVIPFAVVHPDAPQIRSYAFIRVPGYDDALPQINTKAPPLIVNSESTLRIELSQYVVTIGGSRVRLTDSSTVRATHSNDASLVIDDDTLQFTSAERYWGPASITFEVTDGSTENGLGGNVATLSLPIEVRPRDNQPPVFTGGVLEFEPGQVRELDLVKLTKYPHDDDIDELAYTITGPLPTGFSAQLNGQRLLLTADASAVKGATTNLTLAVRDALNDGQAGRLQLRIVPSTRPLAKTVADQTITRRGQTTVVDVLANDAATNPFPGTPLTVVDIRGLSDAALPAGVTVTPSADRSRLSITVAETAEPIDTTLQYQVADATRDPDRYVWGTVTISVQDVPDPVTNLRVTEFGDRALRVGWAPGPFNNAPITEYRVTAADAGSGSVVSTTSCTVTVGCLISTPGNGPSHAMRLSVSAVNAIGTSAPANLGEAIWSDIIPPAPAAVNATAVDRGLRVSWQKPATGGGSSIESYVVSVGGISVTIGVDAADAPGTSYARIITNPDFANGAALPYSVSARNRAPNSLASWNDAGGTGVPAGAPLVLASPSAAASLTDGTSATVDWLGAFDGNGRAITTYYVARHSGAPPACTVTGVEQGAPVLNPPTGPNVQNVGTATSAQITGLTPNTSYTFTVYAVNGQGCTASANVTATPRVAPGDVVVQPGDISSLIDRGDGRWDMQLLGLTIPSGSSDVDSFMYRLSGGSTDQTARGPVPVGSFLTSDTSHYGNLIAVEVKACRTYSADVQLCSPEWSAPVTIGRAIRIEVTGLLAVETSAPVPPDTPGAGYWTWTSGPGVGAGGPGYDSVSYTCGPADDPGTAGVCEVTGVGGSGSYPDLVVSVTSGGVVYTRSYAWSDAPH